MWGTRVDAVQIVLILNIAAIVISLATAGVVAWTNAGSRNLALAVGAFAAATLLFLIQLPFELQRSDVKDRISTSITIDLATPEIRQWAYSPTSASWATWRMPIETGASSWLAANNATAFNGDRAKLTADFVLYSLVRFFTAWEFDWQLRNVTYKGTGSGMIMTTNPQSKPEECTTLTAAQITALLTGAGNSFARVQPAISGGRSICLPPDSTFEVREKALVVRTPICQMSFTVDLADAISYSQPGSGGQTPQLPSGGARYETRWVGFDVETTYFALRAQHRHSAKYREWCTRVISHAREWFES